MTAMTPNLTLVAAEAYAAVCSAYADLLSANGFDWQEEMPADLEDHEVYLYVSPAGDAVIDHAQYFTCFTVYACAPIAYYATVDDLVAALEAGADWDME